MPPPTLLICTVGGSAEAVAAAVKGCSPDRIIFIPSPETAKQIEETLSLLGKSGKTISPGQYDVHSVPDAQNFTSCVERIREQSAKVRNWLNRGQDYRVIVDFTGGTKCMSAALAMVARCWHCSFSYVGGSERNKGGVGIVINGKEKPLYSFNPWDSLGYQILEEGVLLFNRGNYQASADILENSLQNIERPDLKREINSLKMLAEAYRDWDLFHHNSACQKLKDLLANPNNLRHVLPISIENLLSGIRTHMEFLDLFKDNRLGKHVILDICASSCRCARQGKYDDAVARLYRVIEAVAQLKLKDKYGIDDTGKVPLEKVPQPLYASWATSAKEGALMLGLQEDYKLLEALKDSLAGKFQSLGLERRESPLNARNQSILAHGLQAVNQNIFANLWEKALALAEIKENELPVFPQLIL